MDRVSCGLQIWSFRAVLLPPIALTSRQFHSFLRIGQICLHISQICTYSLSYHWIQKPNSNIKFVSNFTRLVLLKPNYNLANWKIKNSNFWQKYLVAISVNKHHFKFARDLQNLRQLNISKKRISSF